MGVWAVRRWQRRVAGLSVFHPEAALLVRWEQGAPSLQTQGNELAERITSHLPEKVIKSHRTQATGKRWPWILVCFKSTDDPEDCEKVNAWARISLDQVKRSLCLSQSLKTPSLPFDHLQIILGNNVLYNVCNFGFSVFQFYSLGSSANTHLNTSSSKRPDTWFFLTSHQFRARCWNEIKENLLHSKFKVYILLKAMPEAEEQCFHFYILISWIIFFLATFFVYCFIQSVTS